MWSATTGVSKRKTGRGHLSVAHGGMLEHGALQLFLHGAARAGKGVVVFPHSPGSSTGEFTGILPAPGQG